MRDNADVKILPPIVLAVALCLGISIGILLPTGLGIVAFSVFLVFAALLELTQFDRRDSESNPNSAIFLEELRCQ